MGEDVEVACQRVLPLGLNQPVLQGLALVSAQPIKIAVK